MKPVIQEFRSHAKRWHAASSMLGLTDISKISVLTHRYQ